MSPSPADTQQAWTTFLMDAELAKSYKMANFISAPIGSVVDNPILDSMLPSQLYVRLGSLVDEALERYIEAHGLAMPAHPRPDFRRKIDFLDRLGRLASAVKVHALRTQRNVLAHQAAQPCTWEALGAAIDDADRELQHLGLVGPRPAYQFCAESGPTDPTEQGAIRAVRYRYGLKENGSWAVQVAWTTNVFRGGERSWRVEG